MVKTLALPFIKLPGVAPRFLAVLDRVNREWGFISGCCKANEHVDACVLRELKEETKDALNIYLTPWNHRKFEVTYCDKSRRIQMHYVCFVIDVSNYLTPTDIVRHFTTSKRTGKCYNENIGLAFFTLEQFRKEKLWPFIRHTILQNEDFQAILATTRS